jgi:periplasmic protein TonB
VILRYSLGLAFGAAFMLLLFWVLWTLVSVPVNTVAMQQAMRVEFTRMRQDTEAQKKQDEKVKQDKPPPVPQVPQMTMSKGSLENNVAQLTPVVDAGSAMSKMKMTAGSDRDIVPLVRINPDYPPRALSRGLQGWVVVQFTITATGTVKDPKVVNSSNEIFNDAALKAIARWRYNPKVEEGVAVERVGVQTKLVFQLEN